MMMNHNKMATPAEETPSGVIEKYSFRAAEHLLPAQGNYQGLAAMFEF
jgi:hypothetical protein